jgi:hypothetical protein
VRHLSQFAKRHRIDQVVLAFAQDKIGARACRHDVLAQVLQVDVLPEAFGNAERRFFTDRGITVEERIGIAEGSFSEIHEPVHIAAH